MSIFTYVKPYINKVSFLFLHSVNVFARGLSWDFNKETTIF